MRDSSKPVIHAIFKVLAMWYIISKPYIICTLLISASMNSHIFHFAGRKNLLWPMQNHKKIYVKKLLDMCSTIGRLIIILRAILFSELRMSKKTAEYKVRGLYFRPLLVERKANNATKAVTTKHLESCSP